MGPPRKRASLEQRQAHSKPPRFNFSSVFACQTLRLVQSPFGWVFWLIEQRISRIEDFLANDGSQ
jgi:hypothetical protein